MWIFCIVVMFSLIVCAYVLADVIATPCLVGIALAVGLCYLIVKNRNK